MKADRDIPSVSFDEESDLPLWVQLRNRMSYLITSGYYRPGDKLPTVRRFAADLRIAYNTVSKAYMGLERDGYVHTVRGSGVFVNDLTTDRQDAKVEGILEAFVEGCLDAGMDYDDIPQLVSSYIRNVKRSHEKTD